MRTSVRLRGASAAFQNAKAHLARACICRLSPNLHHHRPVGGIKRNLENEDTSVRLLWRVSGFLLKRGSASGRAPRGRQSRNRDVISGVCWAIAPPLGTALRAGSLPSVGSALGTISVKTLGDVSFPLLPKAGMNSGRLALRNAV
jgi:hypothetical protein